MDQFYLSVRSQAMDEPGDIAAQDTGERAGDHLVPGPWDVWLPAQCQQLVGGGPAPGRADEVVDEAVVVVLVGSRLVGGVHVRFLEE
jgi:hypothetical protein